MHGIAGVASDNMAFNGTFGMFTQVHPLDKIHDLGHTLCAMAFRIPGMLSPRDPHGVEKSAIYIYIYIMLSGDNCEIS